MRFALAVTLLLGAGPLSATDALKARDTEIRAALPAQGAEVAPELRKKLENLLTRSVDLDAMAQRTLGKTWDAQPKAKKNQFLRVFRARFRSVIGGQIQGYRDSKTAFSPEVKNPDGSVQVPTTLDVKGEPTQVVYLMRPTGAGGNDWRIVDIVIDEVSTVDTYRSSFGKVVAKDGFDGLIAKLSKQVQRP